MATGAADGILRCVYEGCISGYDTGIQRRPYHRNCSCALHSKSRKNCTHGSPRCNNVTYPIRRAWSEGCLALMASSVNSSPSTSPANAMVGGRPQLGLYRNHEEDEEDHKILF
ncbi:Zinc finger, SWIM-type [Quillaja saponaria]|uniref:Zinc finger, SWIM-type n=1 Tax=Quillaja saponaria TaxID=32244 RepID=A0AAD7LFX6_QUISA|nr:Zinc finger, SWIM-type [Quillaja saponaria]